MKKSRASLPGGAVIWQAPPPMGEPRDSKGFAASDAYEAPPEYEAPPPYKAPEQYQPPAVASVPPTEDAAPTAVAFLPPADDTAPGRGELDTFIRHPDGPYAAVR